MRKSLLLLALAASAANASQLDVQPGQLEVNLSNSNLGGTYFKSEQSFTDGEKSEDKDTESRINLTLDLRYGISESLIVTTGLRFDRTTEGKKFANGTEEQDINPFWRASLGLDYFTESPLGYYGKLSYESDVGMFTNDVDGTSSYPNENSTELEFEAGAVWREDLSDRILLVGRLGANYSMSKKVDGDPEIDSGDSSSQFGVRYSVDGKYFVTPKLSVNGGLGNGSNTWGFVLNGGFSYYFR